MNRILIASVACVMLAGTGAATAQGLFGSTDNRYREADSYIDQYGREVIFDPATGRVIAIVQPVGEKKKRTKN